MAKISGVGVVKFEMSKAGDETGTKHDIRNDIRSYEVSREMNEMLTTGLDSEVHTRLQTIEDSGFSITGVVNTDTNRSHDVLKAMRGLRAVDFEQVAGVGFSGNYVQMSYNKSRSDSGELSFTAEFKPAGPITIK